MAQVIRKNIYGQTIRQDTNSFLDDVKGVSPFETLKLITLGKASQIISLNNGIFYGVYKENKAKKVYLEDAFINESELKNYYKTILKGYKDEIEKYNKFGYNVNESISDMIKFSQEKTTYPIKLGRIDSNGLYIMLDYLGMHQSTYRLAVSAIQLYGKKASNLSILKFLENELKGARLFIPYLKVANVYVNDERFKYFKEISGLDRRECSEILDLLLLRDGQSGVEAFLDEYKKGGLSK